ncbi:leucine-rich repeat domain-containing protein [Paracoccus sp. SSK6]|uniref:leucine-rich repeat domain-containing protein n=1 Tax=Paracoccus sp. SSK6 TaxID=3143131 RepID=UPI00321A73DA
MTRTAFLGLFLALAAHPLAAQEPPRMVLFEDPALSGDRLHYPLLISEGRGYRIACATQADEEKVIRGLGFTSVPSEVLTAVDPVIVAARPGDNPALCPTAPDYPIKAYAAEGPSGLTHYLHFPVERGAATFGDRLYVPECAGLAAALGIDLAAATAADPTPFFAGKIHTIACIAGDPIQPAPTSFAAWCRKADRTPAQTATVMAMLDATPGGISAMGDPAACNAADAFLRSITTLDLGGKDVQSLEPLAHLPQLQTLLLADNRITDLRPLPKLTALGHLDLSGNGLTSVAALAPLTQLTRLDLSDNPVTDIRALAALPLLTSLSLDRTGVTDLQPLRFLVALTRLTLSGNGLTGAQVEPLTALGNLTLLDLSQNAIEDFAHLGSFPSTLDIDLTGNPIVQAGGQDFLDLCILDRDAATPFGQTIRAVVDAMGGGSCQTASDALRATTALDLSSKILTDIRPLGVLTHLTRLDLSGNAIADVTPLAGLTELVELKLAGNDITDIRPVGALLKLQVFDASDNPVRLDDFLSACLMRHHKNPAAEDQPLLSEDQMLEVTALLAGSGRTDCQPAAQELAQLHAGDFSNAGLRTLSYFGILQNVRALGLGNNQLSDVTGLTGLPHLTDLGLGRNQIGALGTVLGLGRLERLSLANNPIAGLNGIAGLSRLKSLDISGTNIRLIGPLAQLPNLESVRMRDLPLAYENLRDMCFVNRFDPIAMGTLRPFMEALAPLMAGSGVAPDDCAAVEVWANDRRSLNLNKKNIIDIDPVRFFPNLEELYLFDNLVTDLRPLTGLGQLKTLNVATNRLSALPPMNRSLVSLDFDNNLVTDLSPLSGMAVLGSLSARNNRIETMAPLAGTGPLNRIDLRDNRIGTVHFGLLDRTYLGGNPLCVSFGFMDPSVVAACNRTPPLILHGVDVIQNWGEIVVQPNERFLTCNLTNSCIDRQINPRIFVREGGIAINR